MVTFIDGEQSRVNLISVESHPLDLKPVLTPRLRILNEISKDVETIQMSSSVYPVERLNPQILPAVCGTELIDERFHV